VAIGFKTAISMAGAHLAADAPTSSEHDFAAMLLDTCFSRSLEGR